MKRLKRKVCSSYIPFDTLSSGHSRSHGFSPAEADRKVREAKEKGEDDYRGDSKFATHLKTSTSVSTFAKSRTLKEQREYLPAFACREELLKILRENQGLQSRLLFSKSTIKDTL